MDRETYAMMARLMSKIPPKEKTPLGQKFHIGEIVKISNPLSWFAEERCNGELFQVKYSYAQKYGGDDVKQYSLKHLFEDNSSSWYDEEELELVKGIDEINEERDRSEYERLKNKYEN